MAEPVGFVPDTAPAEPIGFVADTAPAEPTGFVPDIGPGDVAVYPEGSPEYQDIQRARPTLATEIPAETARGPTLEEAIQPQIPTIPTQAVPREPYGGYAPTTVPEAYREAGGGVGGILNALDFIKSSPIIDENQTRQLVRLAAAPARIEAGLTGDKEVEQAIEDRTSKQLSGFTTLESLGQFILFKYPIVRAAAAAQSLYQVPGNIRDIARAYQSGDKQALGEAIADASMNSSMGLGLAAEPLGVTAHLQAVKAEKAFRAGDITVPELLQRRQYYTSREPSGFQVDPGITASIARQRAAQATLTPDVTRAFAAAAQPEGFIPDVQREPTGPIAETAIEQAMRRTGTPLRSAEDVAMAATAPPRLPAPIPGLTTEPSPLVAQTNEALDRLQAARQAARPEVAPPGGFGLADIQVREEPPVPAGMVRIYGGGRTDQVPDDFTSTPGYAQYYAERGGAGTTGAIWYADVPQDNTEVTTHDAGGTPLTRIRPTPDVMARAKILRTVPGVDPGEAPGPLTQRARQLRPSGEAGGVPLFGARAASQPITRQGIEAMLEKYNPPDVKSRLEFLADKWDEPYMDKFKSDLENVMRDVKTKMGNVPFNQADLQRRLLTSDAIMEGKPEEAYPVPVYVGAEGDPNTVGLLMDRAGNFEHFEGNDEATPQTLDLVNNLLGNAGKMVRVYTSQPSEVVERIKSGDIPPGIFVSPDRAHAAGYWGEGREVTSFKIPMDRIAQHSDVDWQIRSDQPAMESVPTPAEAIPAVAQKLRLRAQNKGGYINADVLRDAIDLGKRLYTRGIDALAWGREMVRHLGDAIREHLGNIWTAISGQEPPAIFQKTLPGAYERGSVPIPSQGEIESAANDPQKMRGHIATVQRMIDVSPDVKSRVESWYTPTTLESVNRQANAAIDGLGLKAATDSFMNSRTTDAATMALGHNLALRLDSLGQYADAAMVRDQMAAKLTTPAQAMWFISTISKTSPEGLIRTAQKLMSDLAGADKTALLAEINRLRGRIAAFPEGKAREAATRTVLRQLAKVDKPGQRLSADQLDTLLERHKGGQLTTDDLAQFLAKAYKIPQLTPENIAKIKAAQAAWAAVPDDNSILKLQRAGDMMDSVYGLVPNSVWEKIRATAVMSMIMHGKLPIRIGITNAIRMGGQTLVDTIQNVPYDLGNVFSGRSTVTGAQLRGIFEGLGAPGRAYRVGYEDAKLRGLGTMPSFREGMRTMIDLASMTTRGIYEMGDIRSSHIFSSRFGRLAEDAVTLVHNTVPYAFWDAGYRSSLYRQMAIARVDTPSAEMIANAHIDANKAIFYNDTALYNALLGVRKAMDLPTAKITKGKYGFGTALIPFAKVPAAVATEGLTWTPFGLTKAGWEILRPVVTKEPFRAKEVGDAIVKAALGTGGLMLAGYQLHKIGVLTGAPDENKDLEAMRKAAGWGGFKINVSELKRRAMSGNWWTKSAMPADGDTIVNYNWLEPVAFPLAMGADIDHSQDKREIDLKRGKITSNAVLSAVGAGFQTLTDLPMLQGIENLASSIGEKQYARVFTGILTNVPANFVPSVVRQTSQYMDNTIRETRGGTLVDQEAGRIMSMIPGLAQRYPARYDVFGDAMQRYNYGNNSLINVFFNPAMVSKFKSNPELAEMQRIYEATGSPRAEERQVPRSLNINGKQVQLTNDQVAAYQRYVGKESSTVITRLIASPQYAAEPLQTKQAVIAQVLGAVNTAAKVDLFGQSPVTFGIGAKGPTARGPSAMELAAILGARNAGLKAPVRPIPGPLAGPKQPVWPLAPRAPLPTLAR